MHKKYLTWFWLFGFAALLCFDARAQSASAPGQIKAVKVVGTVTATKDGTAISLENGTELSQGYVVNTGRNSSVVLVFSNGATLDLAQDTSLSIDEFTQDPFAEEVAVSKLKAEPTVSQTKLNLSRGELVGNVKKLNYDAGSSFSIQTPVGAAGIRGTTFRIVFRPDGTGKAFFSLVTAEGNVVLATGTIAMPNNLSVPDNQEITIELDIQVDDQTGVTVAKQSPGSDPITVKESSAATIAQVTQAAQAIAQAVSTAVFTPPPATTPPGTSPPTTTTTTTENAPPVVVTIPRTTPGDGQ
ncbi:MAG: FecR domain-containing protein [Opitutaceae bacterium]|jgi:hypothetical protein|nr:FecR domain-containing protein [Opitutaceae bacterium]MBP9912613.1 FecR domain-containing protein [Opitutaceae bacterium]